MFAIHCARCGHRQLTHTGAVHALHNTASGPVAEVSCVAGHLVLHHFRTGRSEPLHPELAIAG